MVWLSFDLFKYICSRFLLLKTTPQYKNYRARVNELRARGDFDAEEKYVNSDNDTQSFVSGKYFVNSIKK